MDIESSVTELTDGYRGTRATNSLPPCCPSPSESCQTVPVIPLPGSDGLGTPADIVVEVAVRNPKGGDAHFDRVDSGSPGGGYTFTGLFSGT